MSLRALSFWARHILGLFDAATSNSSFPLSLGECWGIETLHSINYLQKYPSVRVMVEHRVILIEFATFLVSISALNISEVFGMLGIHIDDLHKGSLSKRVEG